ncbi:MAG: FecR domain-containing protein [Pseudomonadota bacterium]
MNTAYQPLLLGLALSLCTLLAQAAPRQHEAYAVVESVQMPSWMERQGVRSALTPGQVLRNEDRIITGAEARALINLSEGSAVKLGENAQLDLHQLGRQKDNTFTAALDIAKGAFRFTTGVFAKLQQRRSVNLRVATITAGIRGTDVWGSADKERDLICLLEGKVSVQHGQDAEQLMTEPLSFYVVPNGQAANPIGQVDAEKIKLWSLETEISKGSGYASRGGKWRVELARFDNESAALALYDQARTAGYPVSLKPRALGTSGAQAKPSTPAVYHYVVQLTQLPSKLEAQALAEKLKQTLSLSAPVVKRSSLPGRAAPVKTQAPA